MPRSQRQRCSHRSPDDYPKRLVLQAAAQQRVRICQRRGRLHRVTKLREDPLHAHTLLAVDLVVYCAESAVLTAIPFWTGQERLLRAPGHCMQLTASHGQLLDHCLASIAAGRQPAFGHDAPEPGSLPACDAAGAPITSDWHSLSALIPRVACH